MLRGTISTMRFGCCLVSVKIYRIKIKETYTGALEVLPCKRLIGAEIDFQLVCTGAATSLIRWYIRLAKFRALTTGQLSII